MTINASDIVGVAKDVMRPWTQLRKAEERGSKSRFSRKYKYSDRVNFTEVADEILPNAYEHASGGGFYPVSKRQLFYAARDDFNALTGRDLDYNYFATNLLVLYMNRNPDETQLWTITADPRGTLTIPNAHHDVHIPCGTLDIEEHLLAAAEERIGPLDEDINVPFEFPSLAHGQRYQSVLYIEKQGFEPLLVQAKIAERYDVAILSCKGQSVVAARRFVDHACSVDGGVPLLVVHDFDKAGFEISQRLTTVSRWAEENGRVPYWFENQINVSDVGLRLADVEEYGLVSEHVNFKGRFAHDSITTPEERSFLRSDQRVELNAFTSPQFIEWLETKLKQHGLGRRLIPDDDVLDEAYRRALAVARVNNAIDAAAENAKRATEDAVVPKTLKRQLRRAMKERPDEPWDQALYRLARSKLGNGGDE